MCKADRMPGGIKVTVKLQNILRGNSSSWWAYNNIKYQ